MIFCMWFFSSVLFEQMILCIWFSPVCCLHRWFSACDISPVCCLHRWLSACDHFCQPCRGPLAYSGRGCTNWMSCERTHYYSWTSHNKCIDQHLKAVTKTIDDWHTYSTHIYHVNRCPRTYQKKTIIWDTLCFVVHPIRVPWVACCWENASHQSA